jgi:hypothetical protein
MSIKNFVKVYQVIQEPSIISKCIRFFNKKSKDKKFEDGGLWTGENSKALTDKKVRDVQILSLSNLSESLSEVHWANLISYYILKGMRVRQRIS